MKVEKEFFGNLNNGTSVYLYKIKNDNGIEIVLSEFGATLIAIKTPDFEGKTEDIILGYDTLHEYITRSSNHGALIGRFANRIANGRFFIDNVEYNLGCNAHRDHLHGGFVGFGKKLWGSSIIEDSDKIIAILTHLSKDGDEGYPGNLSVKVSFTLNNDNELIIDFFGKTDKPTIVNLTSHPFFNLHGESLGSVLDHYVTIYSEKFTKIDSNLIPTGELVAVDNTPMDFRDSKRIDSIIDYNYDQINFCGGYDHNWALDNNAQREILASCIYEETSKRGIKLYTDLPGLQFFTGNFLNGNIGKYQKKYFKYYGLCLEPQYFPDAPNHPQFISPILYPDEEYKHVIKYKFFNV